MEDRAKKLDFRVPEQLMVKTMKLQKIALLSVYHKDGIVEFAQRLITLGWRIISSGGTAKTLSEAGVSVEDVAKLTGRKAILGHRVVTLDPAIHGGLLATEDMRIELKELGFPWIDLVCVDLYPLKEAIVNPEATTMSVIDQTDIGGPTMLRSAAKGRRIVIADPGDRAEVLTWIENGQPDKESMLTKLAAKAEGIIADYCLASARFHSKGKIDGMVGTQVRECKYGENGWQKPAGLYTTQTNDSLAVDQFCLITKNKVPGFVNECDHDRLLQTITHIAAAFDLNYGTVPYIAVVVKHGNACGAGIGESPIDALKGMIDGDPIAIFGGVMITNFPIDNTELDCVRTYKSTESKRFLSGIIAPQIYDDASEELAKSNCYLQEVTELENLTQESLLTGAMLRPVRGGFLKQQAFTFVLNLSSELNSVTTGFALTSAQRQDILLAWAIGSTSTSNTITLVRHGILIGNGTGQQDRVKAAELSVERARRGAHKIEGSVAYSDSFFPFPDGVEVLTKAGVKAIFASSGSRGDEAVVEHCVNAGVTLCMLPDTVCRGFYGH